MSQAAPSEGGAPARLFLLLIIVSTGLSALLAWRWAAMHQTAVDFGPIWAGARFAAADPSRAYDFRAVTDAHAFLLPPDPTLRPFVYPPTALLAFQPLGALPFWPAYAAFVGGSAMLFGAACWRAFRDARVVALALAAPAAGMTMVVGQVTLLIGALVMLALASNRRPVVAGLLLGLAAAVKPQVVVLAPLALLADRNWRGLAAAAATGGAMLLAATALWGPQIWRDWLQVLGPFQRLIADEPSLRPLVVSPAGVLAAHGLAGTGLAAAHIGLALTAAAAVWTVFRRTDDPAYRLMALVAGSLFATPYALRYELAMLVPAAAALALRPDEPRRLWRAGALLCLAMGFAGLLGALALTWAAAAPRTWRARQDSNLQPSA